MKFNWRMLLRSSKSTILTSSLAAFAVIGLLSLAGCGGGGATSATQNSAAQSPAAEGVANTSTSAAQPHMIGGDQRMAVVYECWYALKSSYKSPNAQGPMGAPTIWGNTVSNWNYLNDDPNAFNFVRSLPSPGPYCSTANFNYPKDAYGRGGQCTFFATLIIKRARNITLLKNGWNYGNSDLAKCPLMDQKNSAHGQPGDIMYYSAGNSSGHVAIIVSAPNASGVEVVDSNYTGYGYKWNPLRTGFDGASSEIISRHVLPWSEITGNHYKLYSGNGRWYNI